MRFGPSTYLPLKVMRTRINYWMDLAALVSAFVVFPTGLILLARFHIGPDGQQRLAAFGVSRAVWLYLHQSSAVVMVVAAIVHLQLHWRTIVARLRRAWQRPPGKGMWSDLALYFGFAAVTLAAFAAWLLLPDFLHHPAIDLHNMANLVLLPGLVMHVRRHIRWLFR